MKISRSILLIGINCLSLQCFFLSWSHNDCRVQFSQLGCLVQDQHSVKIITKGPKVGRLFPIHFLLSPNLSLPLVSCNFATVDYQVWHKRLGHPKSNVLHDMLKSSFLGNKHTPSLNAVHFDCISCKLGKSKILPFPNYHPNVTQPFDIIHSDVWGWHQLYLMSITNMLLLSLMIIVISLGFIFCTQKMKCFLLSNSFMLMFKPNSLPKSKFFALIMEGNTHHTHFRSSCNPMTLYLKGHAHQPHNKLGFSSPSLGNEPSFSQLFGHSPDYFTLHIFGCVMSIFLHKPNSMHNLFNVLFLDILLVKRVFYVMILIFVRFEVSRNVIFQEHIFFCNVNGSIDCYKAWLVVLGNKQEYGLDYDETFALVAKMTTVCTILALAASQYWPLHQIDVKNAFLHSDLKEEVYIKLLYGMHIPSPNIAPRVQFEKFRSTILGFSFTQSQYNPSLFLQRTPKGIMVLLVYVDDIVVIGSYQKEISRIKHMLYSTFQMKELGHLTYFLGLEQKYIQDLVQLAGLTNSTPIDTPFEVNVKYRQEEGDILDDPTLYHKLVGNLIYVTITCPNISFAIHNYKESLDISLAPQSVAYFFPTDSSLNLQAYSDADWAGFSNIRKFTTG
ncbi:hypothetical protein CR513_35559, partial [Mucuna pruriens]